ncbi:pentatricopeptide repeat-containing protein At3g49170, chloroplastic-like [Olea europaea var. sylvestris]|uniref:pentatricopeptide repeat-containing protein At3g49170, chloroplastic-like n=1 Tax=Olea europaea var. sylvestris TaxID=158386 RepID=UPI000C1D08B5|nr:pentatricopeptide repeat-containing protein At3g49170, chloroplastic-like [Olea europaea var. sylvestris]
MLAESVASLLHHCAKTRGFRHGISLHATAIKAGIQSEVYIGNHILNFYAKCGHIDSAYSVFDEMSHKNLITWSAMISGSDQARKSHSTLELYLQMQKYHKPNDFIFASALSSCAALKELKLGQQIHAQVVKLGYQFVCFAVNSLILMYMKCGMCSNALSIFSDCSISGFLSFVSYNVAITGAMENERAEKGFEIFKLMGRQGLVPDCFTFAGLLGGSEPTYDLSVGMQLHCQMVKLGLDYTNFTGNTLIAMYSKFHLIEEAEMVFRLIRGRDVISWNTLLSACCHCDDESKSLSIFGEMLMDTNVKADDFTYASVLSAAAGLASMRHGMEIHAHLIRTRSEWDLGVANALVNMYSKSGCIGYAYTVFDRTKYHNLVSWNTIIAGFANHGLAGRAMELYEEMRGEGLKPDSVTFLGLLIACNHSGLANEGQYFFNSMTQVYEITPDIEHFCCLVDLLGRAGRVKEALDYMSRFPFGDDPIVLGCLLSACRLHGDVIAGEQLARRLLKLQPVTTSPYVLLANLYASNGKWDNVAMARKLLQGSRLKKEPGHSLIEVKGSVEMFMVGDFSHSRIEEIVNLLCTLDWTGEENLLTY